MSTLKDLERRYAAAFYYEVALPDWAWFRRWRARREWRTWLGAMREHIKDRGV